MNPLKINPIKAEEPTTHRKTTTGKFSGKLFSLLFYVHLLLIIILIFFSIIRGLSNASNNHHFNVLHVYLPLLTSSGTGVITAVSLLTGTRYNPAKTVKAAFWISPILTCGVGILLLSIGSGGSLAGAGVTLIFALIQALYGCWVVPRIDYTIRVLTVSIAVPAAGTAGFLILSIITGMIYSCFSVSGIGGATSAGARFDAVSLFVILLSLTWTMHVIRNVCHVAISNVAYMYFARGMEVDTRVSFKNTMKHSLGNVCVGSVLVPILGAIHGSGRAVSLISNDTDEFMFSCTNCFSRVGERLVRYGHRWGFVHVGVYEKGFVRASVDTWELFERVGLESVIYSDLTVSVFFLCGVAGGAVSSLVCGSWALNVDKRHATEVSIYAFLIGYFMTRIATAWPQACVSAYHVAYAENPQSDRFDTTIPNRIQELQRSGV